MPPHAPAACRALQESVKRWRDEEDVIDDITAGRAGGCSISPGCGTLPLAPSEALYPSVPAEALYPSAPSQWCCFSHSTSTLQPALSESPRC